MTTGDGNGDAYDPSVEIRSLGPMPDDERAGVAAYLAYQIEESRRAQAERDGDEYVPLSADDLAERVAQKITAAVAYHAAATQAARTAATVNARAKVEQARADLAAAEAAAEEAEAESLAEEEQAAVALQIAGVS